MTENILESPFLQDFKKVTIDMWLKGWNERNGGNASYRLTSDEVTQYVQSDGSEQAHRMPAKIPSLAGECFLVTGRGKYFRNVILHPAQNCGVIKIDSTGENYRILWGFENGVTPTSELPAHLLTHVARIAVTNGECQVVLHGHATNLIALSNVIKPDTRTFTRMLWEAHTECIIVFPEGIGVLPWMMPGSTNIGEATAALMLKHQLVLWPFHGVFGVGTTLDEAFGLIDTAEKAAGILVKIISMGGMKQRISHTALRNLANEFDVKPLDGVLDTD